MSKIDYQKLANEAIKNKNIDEVIPIVQKRIEELEYEEDPDLWKLIDLYYILVQLNQGKNDLVKAAVELERTIEAYEAFKRKTDVDDYSWMFVIVDDLDYFYDLLSEFYHKTGNKTKLLEALERQIEHQKLSLHYSGQEKDYLKLSKLYFDCANLANELEEYDRACDVLNDYLKVLEEDKNFYTPDKDIEKTKIFSLLGLNYEQAGSFDRAIKSYYDKKEVYFFNALFRRSIPDTDLRKEECYREIIRIGFKAKLDEGTRKLVKEALYYFTNQCKDEYKESKGFDKLENLYRSLDKVRIFEADNGEYTNAMRNLNLQLRIGEYFLKHYGNDQWKKQVFANYELKGDYLKLAQEVESIEDQTNNILKNYQIAKLLAQSFGLEHEELNNKIDALKS